MVENDFLPRTYTINIEEGSVTWNAPSNIALVKYWGKLPNQIPANASISFTLNNCVTTTTLHFTKKVQLSNSFDFELYFENEPKPDFKPKIQTFFNRIEKYVPFLKDYSFKIETSNSFPHSSGIASSASGMSALALCITSLENLLSPALKTEYLNKKASFLARLGSGSACRSIDGGLVVWGMHEAITNSSDLYGVKLTTEVAEVFKNFQDTILLVDKGVKQVSSTVGHYLMHNHPFAKARFEQALNNLEKLGLVLKSGDLPAFIEIVESEALSLHAMMMCSTPYFILMKPNTLKIIEHIWNFRKQHNIPVCFTLDAGANVHVLYPEKHKTKVLEFIKNELIAYCEKGQYICDHIGDGAYKL